jgi:hypothetical protein
MFDQLLAIQIPARIQSLKFSYGIVASKSQVAYAARLAPSVHAIRPSVYHVGACTCDLWRKACSCKAARDRKLSGRLWAPCVHYLALYLALEWVPADPDPVSYLKSVGVEQPEIVRFDVRVRDRPGVFALGEAFRLAAGGVAWFSLYNLAGREVGAAPLCDLVHVQPVYEEV